MDKKKPKSTADNFFNAFDVYTASSATDCTGLIPSLPQSQSEVESYEEIINFRPPIPGTGNDNQENPPFEN